MNFRRQNDRREVRIDMTPIIDCVFLLLLFFIITSNFVRERSVIKISLPEAGKSSATQHDAPLTVQVAKDGRYYLDTDEPLDLKQLDARLGALAGGESEAKAVRLKADKEVPWDHVVQVLELFQKYKFKQTNIVTRPTTP